MAADPHVDIAISAKTDALSAALAKVRKELSGLPALAEQVNRKIGKTDSGGIGLGGVQKQLAKLYGGARGGLVGGLGGGLGATASAARIVPGLGALAGAASIAGVAELTTRYASMGVELQNTSRLAGTSAAGLNSMRCAARLMGLSAGDADGAMLGLNHTIADAVFGRNPQAAAPFSTMGINIGSMATGAKRAEDVLPEVVDQITRLAKTDPRNAERLANAIGIPSSALPMLMRGREALEANRREVENIYGSFDKYEQSSERFTYATGRLSLASEKLGMTVMTALEPHLTPMLLNLSNWVQRHDHDIGDTFEHIGTALDGINWSQVGQGAERFGHILGEAAVRADDFGNRVSHTIDNLREVIRLVQLPGRLWHDQFVADAAGQPGVEGNGYSTGDPSNLSRRDQAIALAGQASRAGVNSELYATTSERMGRGHGPGVPLTSSAAPAPTNREQERRGREGRDILVGLGWSPAQAAGIMANVHRESGMNEGAVGDNGQAYGIAQWHADRRAKMAAGMGRSVIGMSYADQVRAIDWELRHTERAAGDALRQTTTAAEAAAVVSQKYERPANGSVEASNRAAQASIWDRRWSDAQSAPRSPGLSNPLAAGSSATRDNNGQNTVSIVVEHNNVPAGVTMRATTQGDGAEIGGVRVRRAMPEAGFNPAFGGS